MSSLNVNSFKKSNSEKIDIPKNIPIYAFSITQEVTTSSSKK